MCANKILCIWKEILFRLEYKLTLLFVLRKSTPLHTIWGPSWQSIALCVQWGSVRSLIYYYFTNMHPVLQSSCNMCYVHASFTTTHSLIQIKPVSFQHLWYAIDMTAQLRKLPASHYLYTSRELRYLEIEYHADSVGRPSPVDQPLKCIIRSTRESDLINVNYVQNVLHRKEV